MKQSLMGWLQAFTLPYKLKQWEGTPSRLHRRTETKACARRSVYPNAKVGAMRAVTGKLRMAHRCWHDELGLID